MKNKGMAALLLGMIFVFGAAGCGESTEKVQEEKAQEGGEEKEEKTQEDGEEKDGAAQEDEEVEEGTEETKGSPYGDLGSFLAGTLEGEELSQSDLADKDLTVINFWALTCGPCIREMPELAKLEKALPDNVQLLTVCLDGGQDPETTKTVLEKTGYEGVTIVAGDGDLMEICRRLQYTPTTLFFDQEGTGVGDAIIGAQQELEKVYLSAINCTLEELGKEAIALEE
ncbi:MAG: TlpA disulfide reductase family protein [Eubacteriales bacterium]|nr:TlpA disulfide reductase family protein [Eubacteriales bacterium]